LHHALLRTDTTSTLIIVVPLGTESGTGKSLLEEEMNKLVNIYFARWQCQWDQGKAQRGPQWQESALSNLGTRIVTLSWKTILHIEVETKEVY
jgi:hypothetical protein